MIRLFEKKKKRKQKQKKKEIKERKERYSYKSKQISNENIYIVNPSIWAIYPPFQKSYNFCLVCQQYKVVTTCSVINVIKVQNALTEIAIHRSYCCLFLLGFLMLSCY